MIKILPTATRGMTDKIEVGRSKEDDGIFIFGWKTLGFFISDSKEFVFTIIGSNYSCTILIFELDAVKISGAFHNISIGGTKTLTTGKNIDGFEDRGLTPAISAKDERNFIIALYEIVGVIAKISEFDRLNNHLLSGIIIWMYLLFLGLRRRMGLVLVENSMMTSGVSKAARAVRRKRELRRMIPS